MNQNYLFHFWWDEESSSLIFRVKKEYRDVLRAPECFSIAVGNDYTDYRLSFPIQTEDDFPKIIAFLESLLTSELDNIPLCLAYNNNGTWLALNPELTEFLKSMSFKSGLTRIETAEEAMRKVRLVSDSEVETVCRLTGEGNFLMQIDKNVCTYAFRQIEEGNRHRGWRLIAPHSQIAFYQYLGFLVGFAVLFSLGEDKK